MDVQEYIVSECERQHTLLIDEMTAAFNYAGTITADALPGNDIGLFVQNIARYVEPDVNCWRTDFTNLRVSHVGFMNGGKAAHASEVKGQFERLCYLWSPDFSAEDVEVWIKSLLQIHPWQDGNGRTASILRNWMLNQMSDPEPLPYYRF